VGWDETSAGSISPRSGEDCGTSGSDWPGVEGGDVEAVGAVGAVGLVRAVGAMSAVGHWRLEGSGVRLIAVGLGEAPFGWDLVVVVPRVSVWSTFGGADGESDVIAGGGVGTKAQASASGGCSGSAVGWLGGCLEADGAGEVSSQVKQVSTSTSLLGPFLGST
jgi:hypothetical protein